MKYKLSKPSIGAEEIDGAVEVLKSGNLVYGDLGRKFESALTEYLEVSTLVVSSGTAALYIALKAAKVGPGDAVIVPGFSFPATINVVLELGAIPVICDVSSDTYCLSPNSLESVLNKYRNTLSLKAMILVHEFGCPADMNSILPILKRENLLLIEDAACALGAEYEGKKLGTFGDFGCFSFHPRKTLTTGEGGAVCVNDISALSIVDGLRNHGISSPNGKDVGFHGSSLNFRLTDFQSAMGLSQLPRLDSIINSRNRLAQVYLNSFKNSSLIYAPQNQSGHSWQTFMVVLDDKVDRSKVISDLAAQGIQAGLGAHSLATLPSLEGRTYQCIDTEISDVLYKCGLALPFCEAYSAQELQWIANSVLNSVEKNHSQNG